MLFDYHLHSEFSDDSPVAMEAQIERAIELGVEAMCFTDHVDYGLKKDWDEGDIAFRLANYQGKYQRKYDYLANVNYPEYLAKLKRMQIIYGDSIKIFKGLELGIQTITLDKYNKLMDEYYDQLDFVLLSIHQVDNKEFWTGEYMENKTQDQYVLGYYNEMLACVKAFERFDVLSHIDMIVRYDPIGNYPFEKLKPVLTEIFKLVISKGKGIEINTSSWHYGLKDTTPARDILKLYYDLGGRIITTGSDAHDPKYLADHMIEAQNILKEIGFEAIYTFEKHQPIKHSF